MILSTAMLLDWLAARHDDPRLADAAARIERAVDATVQSGTTRDMGGSASAARSRRPSWTPSAPADPASRGIRMTPTVALIHATPAAMAPARDAFADRFPQARVWNLLDDLLISQARRRGRSHPRCVPAWSG